MFVIVSWCWLALVGPPGSPFPIFFFFSRPFPIVLQTDTGTEIIKIASLPAVVTADLRLNEPRYATLPNIMKAKKKKVDTKDAADYGVDLAARNTVEEVYEPPPRAAGILVDDVDQLVDKLKNEASVL